MNLRTLTIPERSDLAADVVARLLTRVPLELRAACWSHKTQATMFTQVNSVTVRLHFSAYTGVYVVFAGKKRFEGCFLEEATDMYIAYVRDAMQQGAAV